MINYIQKNGYSTIVDGKLIQKKFHTYIESLLNESLRTLDGTRKATTRIFGIKRRIPIYVNNTLLLIQIRSERGNEEALYINYFSLDYSYTENDRTIFSFKDGTSLKSELSERSYKRMLKKAKRIADYSIKHDI